MEAKEAIEWMQAAVRSIIRHSTEVVLLPIQSTGASESKLCSDWSKGQP